MAETFNSRFGFHKTTRQIHSIYGNHNIRRVRIGPGKGNGKPRSYTPEQIDWLMANYAGRSHTEIASGLNARFGIDKTAEQIKSFIGNRGLNTGRTGQFEKGQVSWNKGVKGYMGANATSFKKGNAPANRKPLYTERIDSKDGFILIKVPERNPHTGFPTRYKHKHVWVWEQANGPVPEGHVVAFRDSNKLNCELDNLMLLTRTELLSINLHGYKEMPAELKPTILSFAKIEAKAGFRTRPGQGRRKKEAAL